jgi:uncharacterized protein (TIGR02145 family)
MNRISYVSAILLLVSVAVFNSCQKSATTAPSTPAPATPVMAWNNSPVGIGDTLKFYAAPVAGATYIWTSPNDTNIRLMGQNPTISHFKLSMTGAWTLVTTVNGVSSAPYTTYVTNMQISAFSDSIIPAASGGGVVNYLSGQISTFTTGQTIGLNASTIVDIKNQVVPTTYSWTGPGGFTSKLQNPTIPNFGFSAAGTYSVTASYYDYTYKSILHTSNVSTVTVAYRPAAPKLTSNTPVVGGNLNLMATLAAGANPAADTMFYWTGPNNFSSRKQNPVITNISRAAIGTYTCYTINSSNKAIQSVTGTIAVNVNFAQYNKCGGQLFVIFNGVVYNLIGIQNQCWLQQDLQNSTNTPYLFNYSQATPAGVAPQQGACPVGFHLPNDSMYQALSGFAQYNGNELVSGTGGVQNATGFSATLSYGNKYWSYSTNGSATNADFFQIGPANNDSLISYSSAPQLKTQMLVRCMKD